MIRMFSAILALLLLMGAVPSAAETSGNTALGKIIFQERGCAMCHGEHAEGAIGPSLHGKKLEQVQKVLQEGYTVSGLMPPYPPENISDAELAAISGYLQFMCRDNVASELANRGRKLFVEKGCVACHLPDASDGLLPQSKGHRLWGARGAAFVNKVRKGQYAALQKLPDGREVKHIQMPRYPELTEAEVVHLTAYFQSFCSRPVSVD